MWQTKVAPREGPGGISLDEEKDEEEDDEEEDDLQAACGLFKPEPR